MLTITDSVCDTFEGSPVHRFTLHNEYMRVTLSSLGAAILTLWVPDRNGIPANVAAGYSDVLAYAQNPLYLGCVVGRYVNRIGQGRFVLDGVTHQLTLNEGLNHLHGGFRGFHRQRWEVREVIRNPTEVGVVLGYRSGDGEEGYPGNLDATICYTLRSDNTLCLDYTARTDRRTPVNLTNHSYFNLSAFADPTIHSHLLRVHAGRYTEKNEHNLPTGVVRTVVGTPLDFTTPGPIGERLHHFPADRGLDHNFVLDGAGRTLAAELCDPSSGRRLRVYTDKPCLQVYTANWWDGSILGMQGIPYRQYGAVALETQFAPDSPNQPGFPNTILDPGTEYRTTTIFEFDTYEQV